MAVVQVFGEWAKDTREAKDAPFPAGKTCGTTFGQSLAWKALLPSSGNTNPELQDLLKEWEGDRPYAVFWAEVQEGYHSYLNLMSGLLSPRDRALKFASEFEEKLSSSLPTDSANATADTAHSLASTKSQPTMPVSAFLSLFMTVPPLTEEQP